MNRAQESTLLIVFSLALLTPARGGEESRWYLVEFVSGEHLSARFIAEEKDFYIFNFQGAPLVIAKSGVLKIKPLSIPEIPAGASGFSSAPPAPSAAKGSPAGTAGGEQASRPAAPAKASGEGAAAAPSLSEDGIRDAIEALASDDEGSVAGAYRNLRGSFSAARLLIHEASRHHSPRVRALSLKLLGERGAAKEDLQVVVESLTDGKAPVRLAAGKALRTLGPQGLPDLLNYLPTERETNIRKMAIQTLKDWRDQRAVTPLVALLDQEPDHAVRSFIVGALETITRQKLGENPKAWQDYLAQDRFNGKILHQLEEAKAQEELKPKPADGAESAEE